MRDTAHSQIAVTVAIFLWSVAAFAPVGALQARVVDKATEAPNLASTINIGAFNLGNAAGAFLGGIVIDAGFSLPTVPVAAALVALIGVATAAYGALLDRA